MKRANRSIRERRMAASGKARGGLFVDSCERRLLMATLRLDVLFGTNAAHQPWTGDISIPAGTAVHVNAFESTVGTGTSKLATNLTTNVNTEGNFLLTRMDWDFGESTSSARTTPSSVKYDHNKAVGWNASHVYDTVSPAGGFTVRLTATYANGVSEWIERKVIVSSPTFTTTIYAAGRVATVDNDDEPTPDDLTPEAAATGAGTEANPYNYTGLRNYLATHTNSNLQILLKKGTMFPVSATSSLSIASSAQNVRIGAYPTTSTERSPILWWWDNNGTQRAVGTNGNTVGDPPELLKAPLVRNLVVDGITFGSKFGTVSGLIANPSETAWATDQNDYRNQRERWPKALTSPSGSNIVFRDVGVYNVNTFISANTTTQPVGFLVQDCQTKDNTDILSYFVWLQSRHVSIYGNRVINSVSEHIIRGSTGHRYVTVANNDFTNDASANPVNLVDSRKSSINFQNSLITGDGDTAMTGIWNNRITASLISFGPLGGSDGQKDERASWGVIDSNEVGLESSADPADNGQPDGRILVGHGASNVVIRNNIVEQNGAGAGIAIDGYITSNDKNGQPYNRGTSNVAIVHNTIKVTGAKTGGASGSGTTADFGLLVGNGQFVNGTETASGHSLIGNLFPDGEDVTTERRSINFRCIYPSDTTKLANPLLVFSGGLRQNVLWKRNSSGKVVTSQNGSLSPVNTWNIDAWNTATQRFAPPSSTSDTRDLRDREGSAFSVGNSGLASVSAYASIVDEFVPGSRFDRRGVERNNPESATFANRRFTAAGAVQADAWALAGGGTFDSNANNWRDKQAPGTSAGGEFVEFGVLDDSDQFGTQRSINLSATTTTLSAVQLGSRRSGAPTSTGPVPTPTSAGYTLTASSPVTLVLKHGTNAYQPAEKRAIVARSGDQRIESNVTVRLEKDSQIDVATAAQLSIKGQLTVDNVANGGRALEKTGAGTLKVKAGRVGDLTVSAGKLVMDETGSRTTPNVLVTTGITVVAGAVVEFSDGWGWVVVDYPASYTAGQVQTLINGLDSDVAAGRFVFPDANTAPNTSQTVAVGAYDRLAPEVQTIASAAGADSTSVLIRRTLKGDADMNGTVDFTDLLRLAAVYNIPGWQQWTEGDFNNDGTVNFDDLLIQAANYNISLPVTGNLEG